MNSIKQSLIIFLILIWNSTPVFTQEVLKIRASDWPPQYYKDKNGKWTGLDIELGKALVKEAGFVPKVVVRPWSRSLDELKAGTLHVMMNLSITEERLEFLHYLGPERYSEMVVVVKKDNVNLPLNNLDDFCKLYKQKRKKFGIQNDAFYSLELNTRLKDDSEFARCFQYIAKPELNLKKTVNNRILGFIDDKVTMNYKIRTNAQYRELAVQGYVVSREPVFFGISKKITIDTLKKLYAAYERLVAKGIIEEIRNKQW